MGKASEALVILATTGNPDPLQAETEGTVMSSEEFQKKVGNLANLEKEEHLAPTTTKMLSKNSKELNRTTFEIIPSLLSEIQDVQKGPSIFLVINITIFYPLLDTLK